MPWVKAGTVSPAKNVMGSINLANVVATSVAYRFDNVSGIAPRQFGYFVAWSPSPFTDAPSIEAHRFSIPCWFPAGQFFVVPTNGAATLSRLGFYRLFGSTETRPISLFYFTP